MTKTQKTNRLRNYKSFTVVSIDEHGNKVESEFPDSIQRLAINVEKEIVAGSRVVPKTKRAVCSCGAVEKFDDLTKVSPCSACGCTDITVLKQQTHITYSSTSDFEPIELLDKLYAMNGKVILPCLYVYMDSSTNIIELRIVNKVIAELDDMGQFLWRYTKYMIRSKEESEYLKIPLDTLFEGKEEWISAKEKALEYQKQTKNISELEATALLYNVFVTNPWSKCISDKYLFSLVSRETKYPLSYARKMRATEDEYIKNDNLPVFLRELYPICGFPRNIFVNKRLDDLNEPLKKTVFSAVMHHHIDMNDVSDVLLLSISVKEAVNFQIQMLNEFGTDFAEFFRKNVLEYKNRIIPVYESLMETGSKSIKEQNVVNLEKLLIEEFHFENVTISQFEDLLAKGDALSALTLIANII